ESSVVAPTEYGISTHSSPSVAFDSYRPYSTTPRSPNDSPLCSSISPQSHEDALITQYVPITSNGLDTFSGDASELPYPSSDAGYSAALVRQVQTYSSEESAALQGYTLPSAIVPDPVVSGKTAWFIMSQYERLFELIFFRPAEAHMDTLRRQFVARVMSSSIAHWSSFVGAQMLCTIRQNKEDANIQRFVPWLNRLNQLYLARVDMNIDDLRVRLSSALELAFLWYLISNIKQGYNLLRLTAPVFMQVACADPTLWPRDPSSNGISLAHALLPPRREICRFIFMDSISSFTFGVPPLVEYDTSHPMIETQNIRPTEWIHGCPSRFMFLVVKINQWRAQHPGNYQDGNSPWKEIEEDAWAYRPSYDHDPSSDSGRHVLRVTVQEGWRHTVLIYLYMGMCGVTSHDPRVQSSVQQISNLYNVTKTQSGGMHLLAPALLAGICTRSETDRAKFRALVSQSRYNNMLLLQTMKYAGVLDHLWRGAAANGGPVTWDDYIASRRAVIDVGV
ncbi:hypothetical protein FRC09_003073, partial [Ceratobasidium sp. 395]